MVLAEEFVAAGGRSREADGRVIAALDVLCGGRLLEGEIVLDTVLVGDLDGDLGARDELHTGRAPGGVLRGELDLVVAGGGGRAGAAATAALRVAGAAGPHQAGNAEHHADHGDPASSSHVPPFRAAARPFRSGT